MQTETYKYLQRMRSELLEQLRAEFGIAKAAGTLGPPQPGAAEVPLLEEGRTLPGTPTALATPAPAPAAAAVTPVATGAGSDRFARALFGDFSAPLPQGTDPGRSGEIKAMRTASLCATFDASPAPLRNLGSFAIACFESAVRLKLNLAELERENERLERENHALETELKMHRAPDAPPDDEAVPPTLPPSELERMNVPEEFRGPAVVEGPLERPAAHAPVRPIPGGLKPTTLIEPPAAPAEPSEPEPAT